MSGAALIHDFAEIVTVRRFANNVQTAILQYDSDFVTGNSIRLEINGGLVGPISFATNHNTTLQNLANAIAGNDYVSSATVTGARQITIVGKYAGTELIVSGIIVTGGVTQAEGSITSRVGAYVDGVYQPSAPTEFTIEMSIQPLNGHELNKLPEGDRTKEYMKGYTAAILQIANEANGSRGDWILYNGKYYEVQKAERWMQTDLNHYKVLMAEVNRQTGTDYGKVE